MRVGLSAACGLLASALLASEGNLPATLGEIHSGTPPLEFLQLGSFLSVTVPARCVLDYHVRVVAGSEGGEDAFTVEVWDEGVPVRTAAVSVPADGGQHERNGRIDLPAVSETHPGVAVVLKDGATVLDVEDPVPAACVGLADVPALGSRGALALALLLGALGVGLLARQLRPTAR